MSTANKSKEDMFVKGLNWGSYSLKENEMGFESDSKNWFQIPFNSLSNIQQGTNKNEITLEFNKDDDNNKDSAICEIRLFIPDQDIKKEKEKNKEKNEENNEEQEEDEEEYKIKKTRGELLKEELIKLAGIGSISGSIAHIPEIQTVTPRGKFDIYFLKNSLKIHGQSHNYKTDIKNIEKVFLVPKVDGHFSYLILRLKSPLTQGNTSYPFVIFQIKTENEIKVDLQIPEDDEEIKKKLEDLSNPLEGKTVDVIATLFKVIVNKYLIIPTNNFIFSKGPFIKCSYKANDGVLYFLEKSMLFAHKPVLDISHESIKEIDLARIHESGMQQRSFDMTIKLKKESYQFSGLDREEMDKLQEYIKAKKIKLNSVDENNNNVDMPNYSTRRRAPVEEEAMDLPSEKELGDDDYVDSGEGSEEGDDEDEEEEIEEEEKEKKSKKNKKKKTE